MKILHARLSVFWILVLVIFSSCRKEELISSELIREFRIDTVFYEKLDPSQLVFSDHLVYGNPVLTDEHIYFSAYTGTDFQFVKADLSNGEVLWTWNSFQSGDLGQPRKIIHHQDKVAFITHDFAYVLNATTAQMLYVYSPKQNDQLKGASFFDDHILVSVANVNDGARLDKVALDGTGVTNLMSVQKTSEFDPLPFDVDIFRFKDTSFLAWHVNNIAGRYIHNLLYFSHTGSPENLEQLSLGAGSYGGSADAFFLPGSGPGNRLFAVSGSGIVGAYDLDLADPARWVNKHSSGWLLQNTNNLYAVSGASLAVYDKASGLAKITATIPGKFKALTDNFLLGSTGGYLRLYDSETLLELQVFEGDSEIKGIFKINEDEFFFSNFNEDEEGFIGRIRLTPVHP